MPRKRKQKCLKCKRADITGYGLCNAHYQRQNRKVELKRDTWEAAIKRGDALPLKKDRSELVAK